MYLSVRSSDANKYYVEIYGSGMSPPLLSSLFIVV